jgi:TolB-like protein
MRKNALIALLLMGCTVVALSQAKPKLAILPFTGGAQGDGETIATLFSFQPEILNAFTVVPRTSAVNARIAEQNFQMSGYTDSDTIARLGRELNADFVVSGHIRRLGNSNLIIATIINVETFEQVAGDYRPYRNIEEVRSMLPAISNKMIASSQRNTSRLPKLAIATFSIAKTGVRVDDAETLAQILAIEINNTGRFAVLPRNSTMQAALNELDYQMSGRTAEEEAKALGRAINAEFILFAEVRSLGNINMFTAQILNVEDGSLLAGDIREYRVVDDGIFLMGELAVLLTDRGDAAALISARNRERSRTALFADPSKYWSIGISAGTSFAAPWAIGTIRGTIAPFRNSFLELGFDYGTISGYADAESYYSIYPFIRYSLFMPLSQFTGRQSIISSWYAGAGAGYMLAEYTFPEEKIPLSIFAIDVTAGIILWNMLDISYTLRTDFKSANNKISIGYTYRFQ